MRSQTFAIPWNLFLISVGSFIFAIGVKAVALPHEFISLGSSGGNDVIAVLLNQKFNISMGTFFFGFNLVLFGFSLGIIDVDRVLYSLVMSFVTAQMLDYVLTFFNQRKIVMTVLNNFELKRLEEIVFNIDPDAFVIIERTFNVLGRGFSHRKVY